MGFACFAACSYSLSQSDPACSEQLHLIIFQNGDPHEKNKSHLYHRTRQPER